MISQIPSKLVDQPIEFQLWFAFEYGNLFEGIGEIYLIIPRCIGDCSFLHINNVYTTFEGVDFLVMTFVAGEERERDTITVYPHHQKGELVFKGFHIDEVVMFSINARETNNEMYFKLKNGNRIHH